MIEAKVVDVQRFKEAVWAVERETFRPGNALDALEAALVPDTDAIVVGEGMQLSSYQEYANGTIQMTIKPAPASRDSRLTETEGTDGR